MRSLCLALLLIATAAPAAAADAPKRTQAVSAEREVRALVARWYEELDKEDEGRAWQLFAPLYIDASPYYDYLDTGSRARAPRIYTSLAVRALKFSYEIDSIRLDPNFAKVQVWERGYFYAAAAQTTYENAARTTFVLERQPNGSWLILAHESHTEGIPPNKITDPLPDLRALYYATEGKDRDPEKDAAEAAKF
jgi:hypothetical protein